MDFGAQYTFLQTEEMTDNKSGIAICEFFVGKVIECPGKGLRIIKGKNGTAEGRIGLMFV